MVFQISSSVSVPLSLVIFDSKVRAIPTSRYRLDLATTLFPTPYAWIRSERTFPHMHQGPTFFKTHFVHECLHQINAASAGGVDGPRRGWVRDVRKVKSSTLVSYGHADIT